MGRGGGVDGAIERVKERVSEGVCVDVAASVSVGRGEVDVRVVAEDERAAVEDKQVVAVWVGRADTVCDADLVGVFVAMPVFVGV